MSSRLPVQIYIYDKFLYCHHIAPHILLLLASQPAQIAIRSHLETLHAPLILIFYLEHFRWICLLARSPRTIAQ